MPPQTAVALTGLDLIDLKRVHVTDPLKWGVSVGTDYWMTASANGQGTASGNNLLTDGGWTTTSIAAYADGTAADFLTKADVGTPANYTTDAAADLVSGPAIFGDYLFGHAASVLVGVNYLPRFLIADFGALLSTASADEQTTNLGFVVNGGSPVTSANQVASINSDGTNFRFQTGATRFTNSNNVAVDNLFHWFRIVIDRLGANATTGTLSAYVDGTLIATGALVDDRMPVKVGWGNGVTNRVQMSQVHVFYGWNLNPNPQYF